MRSRFVLAIAVIVAVVAGCDGDLVTPTDKAAVIVPDGVVLPDPVRPWVEVIGLDGEPLDDADIRLTNSPYDWEWERLGVVDFPWSRESLTSGAMARVASPLIPPMVLEVSNEVFSFKWGELVPDDGDTIRVDLRNWNLRVRLDTGGFEFTRAQIRIDIAYPQHDVEGWPHLDGHYRVASHMDSSNSAFFLLGSLISRDVTFDWKMRFNSWYYSGFNRMPGLTDFDPQIRNELRLDFSSRAIWLRAIQGGFPLPVSSVLINGSTPEFSWRAEGILESEFQRILVPSQTTELIVSTDTFGSGISGAGSVALGPASTDSFVVNLGAHRLGVRVVSAEGFPVAGLNVRIRSVLDRWDGSADETDARGRVEFWLHAGHYEVWVAAPNSEIVIVTNLEVFGDDEIEMVLE